MFREMRNQTLVCVQFFGTQSQTPTFKDFYVSKEDVEETS